MTYIDVIKFLENKKKLAWNWDLSRIIKALALCENPQNKLKFVHVAGTNGKGSTAVMIHNILSDSGYKTGLFISPTITDYEDNIIVNNHSISRDDFVKRFEKLHSLNVFDSLTEFETHMVTSLYHFYKSRCDIVVLECGLGGKNDATNIIPPPEIAVFTPISLDHTTILGNTVEEITTAKCGIIKPGCQVVIAPTQNEISLKIIMKYAEKYNCPVHFPSVNTIEIVQKKLDSITVKYSDKKIKIPMMGEHQRDNAVSAVECVNVLSTKGYKITLESIASGLSKSKLKSRQQVVSTDPIIIVDGAHNYESFSGLCNTILHYNLSPITLVIGMLKDKDTAKCIKLIERYTEKVVFCTPKNDRAMSSLEMSDIWSKNSHMSSMFVQDDFEKALALARKICSGNIVVAGSFYLKG